MHTCDGFVYTDLEVACVDFAGSKNVLLASLDISSPESVKAFAEWSKQHLPHGIDILVNNAGAPAQLTLFHRCDAT